MKKTLLITSALSAALISMPAFSGCVGTIVMGKCSGTEISGVNENNSNRYESTSGTTYEYDLRKPSDQIGYSLDNDAKRRDQMSSNPNRKLDQGAGQAGGGIYD